ncbi:MAG TPA: BamA/TamA family outer membrane protein [Gemmatimonadaceae bacterium]|nr:BamA/TamA family outer membrane protein [Gemmatimonadaceae bacterium]
MSAKSDPLARLALAALIAFFLPTAVRAQDVDCDQPNEKEVRSLSFEGNKTFDAGQLSTIVITTPSSFARRYFRIFGTKRCYPSDGLAQDVANLKAFYEINGFYDTKVDTVVTPASGSPVRVTFRINEGQPLTLDSLTITGLDSVADRATILRDLPLAVGRRFGRLQLANQTDSITIRLRHIGYPAATVFPSYDAHKPEHRAEVQLEVQTGDRARFGTIAVRSANVRENRPPEIDSSVVLGLLGFRSGDRYSDRSLVDASRNLYNLGVYRHVSVGLDSTAKLSDSVVRVGVDLREDYMHEITHEEGWATLDCFRLGGQYTDKNFLDHAQRLELTARVSKVGYANGVNFARQSICQSLNPDSVFSSHLNYYAGATVRRPTLFGGHWVPSYSAYTERRSAWEAYLRTTYIGLDVSASRELGRGLPGRVGYTLEYGRTDAEPAYLCYVQSLCTQEERAEVEGNRRLGILSVSLQKNTLDNPIAPKSGYVIGSEVRGAGTITGSDASQSFAKITMDAGVFRAVTSRTVVSLRVRGGLIGGGEASQGTRLPPPQERLYAGGATSVRGYPQNELGPLVYLMDRDQFKVSTLPDGSQIAVLNADAQPARPVPTGGNRLLVLNAELRLRDPFFPQVLEYVPFVDAGQVWVRSAGTPGVNVKPLSVTPGLGIAYFSPIGPIQFNLGYNPNASPAGPAYFAAGVDSPGFGGGAPLVCLTPPGTPPVPFRVVDGKLSQNTTCPAAYSPHHSAQFWNRLTKTLSIGTSF